MMINALHITWIAFQTVTWIMVIFPSLSYFLFCLLKSKVSVGKYTSLAEPDYAVLITAYKDLSNIPNVVNSLLQQHYSNYLIYVVADDCPELEYNFNEEKVIILRPSQALKNQLKSHFYAIDNFKRNHTRLTIIDSDNLVGENYFQELNVEFDKGYEAVQGTRKAKNLDTPYACLDAANEIYYFFYNRKILSAIGSSSMLAGSGMAFTVSLYKECLQHCLSSGAGFDKILQKEIVTKGYKIGYAEKAIVFDEKTSRPNQLVKQRARWNNTWFRFFYLGLQIMGKGIVTFSATLFLFGFIVIRPPMFILLGLASIITILNLFFDATLFLIWVISLLSFLSGFLLALKKSDTDKKIYLALTHIPAFVVLQIKSLLKAPKANKFSVATVHMHHEELEKL